MKKIQIMGWLVMAAAFITTFTACSSDDNNEAFGDSPVEPVRTVSVTVGAGITDDATTRSGIIEGTHTLKFTTGDKLFVRAMYGDENGGYYTNMLTGFLTINENSLSDDDKSASFSGTLVQYTRNVNSTDNYTYTLAGSITVSFISDPIDEAVTAFATLVHKDAILGTDYTDKGWDINYPFNKLATDVNRLMTKNLAVTGEYGKVEKSFKLNGGTFDPILDCTINGLTENATYTVTYTYGEYAMSLSPTVTAYGNTAKFAFFGTAEGKKSHVITLVNTNNDSDKKIVDLGEKDLGTRKIYNVARTATATQ